MISCRTIFGILAVCSVSVAADLNELATVRPDTISRRGSSFDRAGGNEDSIASFAPKASIVLLDTDGPGKITHVWLTVGAFSEHPTFLRDLVMRMSWENSPVPSVEVPLGDFFAQGHGMQYTVQSVPIAVGISNRALNCYWPMPSRNMPRSNSTTTARAVSGGSSIKWITNSARSRRIKVFFTRCSVMNAI